MGLFMLVYVAKNVGDRIVFKLTMRIRQQQTDRGERKSILLSNQWGYMSIVLQRVYYRGYMCIERVTTSK